MQHQLNLVALSLFFTITTLLVFIEKIRPLETGLRRFLEWKYDILSSNIAIYKVIRNVMRLRRYFRHLL